MKKGIFIILGFMVLSLVSRLAFTGGRDLDVEFYQGIMVKNELGEFYFSFPFAVVQHDGRVSQVLISTREHSIEFKTIPNFVWCREKKNGLYDFWVSLVSHPPGLETVTEEEKVYFIDSKWNHTAVALDIRIDWCEDIQELESWQKFLALADEGGYKVPVKIKGTIVRLEKHFGLYKLTIKIDVVSSI